MDAEDLNCGISLNRKRFIVDSPEESPLLRFFPERSAFDRGTSFSEAESISIGPAVGRLCLRPAVGVSGLSTLKRDVTVRAG